MRWGMRLLAAFLALLLLFAVATLWLLQQRLSAAGFDQLDWRGLGWSAGALHVDGVSARYTDSAGARLEIDASQLLIEPIWAGGPALAVLQAQRLELDWEPQVVLPGTRSTAMPDIQQLAESLRWLPTRHLSIAEIAVQLPCGIRTCNLVGGLKVQRERPEQFRLRLELLAEQGSIELGGYLQNDGSGLQADLTLQLDEAQAARLQAQWTYGDVAPSSQGALSIPDWPQANWLLDYMQPWLGMQPPVATLPTGLRADVHWSLAPLDRPQTFADLLGGAVELTVEAALAEPWKIPELGSVDGEITLDLLGDNGLWQLRQARSQLQLTEPLLPALANLPVELRPQALQFEVTVQADSPLGWSETLPLLLDTRIEGPVAASLTGPLLLASRPQWSAQWDALQLRMHSEQLDLPVAQLRQLELVWSLAGRVGQNELDLEFAQEALVSAASIRLPDLAAMSAVRADLAGLKLQIPLDEPAALAASGPLMFSVGRLEHAALKPQAWTVRGELTLDEDELRWAGSVAAASELNLGVSLVWPAAAAWRADLKLEPIFLRAADPLSATLEAWPQLLTFGGGRLQGQLSLHGDTQVEEASGQIELDGVAGIYDRMTFAGLNALVDIDLAGERLQVDVPELGLETLDPGIPAGPLEADLHYAAHIDRLASGSLRVEQARLQVLGGQLALQPTVLDLGGPRQNLVVDIRGLELDRLFAVYPAEGLRGRGTLDGRLPVALVDGELVIEAGEVGARAPGGFLQYRSDKLENLAETTPGMRQVAQALDDFHYDLLNADVTYGEGGILILGLQLQGRNPALQEGRPIHLNIRLEEDIPALLASLQLSGKVSDVIQQRIRQRLLEQQADP